MSRYEFDGDAFAKIIEKGIADGLWQFFKPFVWAFIAIVVIQIGLGVFGYGKDSTDPADGRSGMELRTDAMTGCQYLESRDGFLTPRMDRDGKQVCK